ncbi:MAG: ABC transporter ATP-binding protein [Eubacteriales bacterium]
MNVIETNKLTKSYGESRGIVELDLTVQEGEIFGFIGPNGAGKSTTIRTLLGLIRKTSGEATVFGMDIWTHKKEILQNVGYLPSEVFYYDHMRAVDLLEYSASFYKKDCKKRMKELADVLELDLYKKINSMSLGNKKKVGIIQGLLHSPRLIILDEPTSGLDPLIQKRFFQMVQEENQGGATILFSSHILSEVQKMCHRVAIIKEGRIIATQEIAQLKEKSFKKVVALTKEEMKDFNLEGATELEQAGHTLQFLFKGDCNQLLSSLNQYELQDIQITEPDLEEIFMHYYS